MLRVACEIVMKKGLVSDRNDLLGVTAGFPFGTSTGTPGESNIVRLLIPFLGLRIRTIRRGIKGL